MISRIVRARTLAEELVREFDLRPPVPILDLLDGVAEVKAAPWPHSDVDALIPDLDRHRPTVLYRSGSTELRRRFTLAHEYGHIQMLWHGGRRSCVTGEDSVDLVSGNDEQEADLFASTLMAPDGWLQQRRHEAGGDMSKLLNSLKELELSAIASIRALRRVISAGWVFRLGDYTINSPGTATNWTGTSQRGLVTDCYDHARVTLHGKRVDWFRMFADDQPPDVDDDPRDTTQILRDILARLDAAGAMADDPISLQSVNGKIGGSTSRITGAVDEIYQHLMYRFSGQRYRVLLEDPEFHLFLARKARAIYSGNTVRGRRRR